MKATFATDKLNPGRYLARVELKETDPAWPEVGSAIELTRKDGTKSKVELGKVVWSGPDGEQAGVEVALYRITASLDEGPTKRRPPPGVKR